MHARSRFPAFPAFLAVATAAAASPALADDEYVSPWRTPNEATWSATVENDSLGSGSDSNYTSGLHLSWVSGAGHGGKLARILLRADEPDATHLGFALGQSIFTAQDITLANPPADQHPYAGWLYGEFSVLAERHGHLLDALTVTLGVVGPAAQGEAVQNGFHDLIGIGGAEGWDTQLKNEPAFAVAFDRIYRPFLVVGENGLGFDVATSFGATAGTQRTSARTGLTVRFGEHLDKQFGPPRIRPSVSTGGFFERTPGFNWYVFAGGEVRAVARDIFLDGNTFRASRSVDKNTFVGDLQAGLVTQFNRFQLSYTFVARTREFEAQEKRQIFGAVSLSAKF